MSHKEPEPTTLVLIKATSGWKEVHGQKQSSTFVFRKHKKAEHKKILSKLMLIIEGKMQSQELVPGGVLRMPSPLVRTA